MEVIRRELRLYGSVENLVECLFGETVILPPKSLEGSTTPTTYQPLAGRNEATVQLQRLVEESETAQNIRRDKEPDLQLRVARELIMFRNTARVVFDAGMQAVALVRTSDLTATTTGILNGTARTAESPPTLNPALQGLVTADNAVRGLFDDWAREVAYMDAGGVVIGPPPTLLHLLLALITNKPLFVTLDYFHRVRSV